MGVLKKLGLAFATAIFLVTLGTATAEAAPGDRVLGDGTGPNAILTTNRCSSALAYSAGNLGPYAKIERESAATRGTCDLRSRVSYYDRNGTYHLTGWTYRRDFVSTQGPQDAQRCRGYVGVKRNDGTWLDFTFYNNVGRASCKKP